MYAVNLKIGSGRTWLVLTRSRVSSARRDARGEQEVPVTSLEITQLRPFRRATVHTDVAQTARLTELSRHLGHLLRKLARRYKYQTLQGGMTQQ